MLLVTMITYAEEERFLSQTWRMFISSFTLQIGTHFYIDLELVVEKYTVSFSPIQSNLLKASYS